MTSAELSEILLHGCRLRPARRFTEKKKGLKLRTWKCTTVTNTGKTNRIYKNTNGVG